MPPLRSRALFAKCHVSRKPLPTDGVLPTRLFCKNAGVDQENSKRLDELQGQAMDFAATDTFATEPANDRCARPARPTGSPRLCAPS